MKVIVVEGAGDVADRFYAPALAKLKSSFKDLRVIFTDMSEYWRGADVVQKRTQTIEQIKRWGAEFIDKTQEKEKYLALMEAEVDVVFVATSDRTHIKVTEDWLNSNCKQIFVEKPLSDKIYKARKLLDQLNRKDYRIRAFDHYRAKIHLCFRHEGFMEMMILTQLGELKKFQFYLLEDHSGTDKKYVNNEVKRRNFKDRNGPIENEVRQDELKNGLILDLMPHMPALVHYFGHPGTIAVSRVLAGRYTGVDYEEDKPAEIEKETFAAVEFNFFDYENDSVEGEAFIGKGIRGSRKYPEMDGNVKVLELEGSNGAKIRFDFQKSLVSLLNRKGKETQLLDLQRDPYYYFLEQIAYGDYKGTDLGMPVETGKRILEILEDMRYATKRKKLPTYKLGDKKGRFPPYLEDLIEEGENRLPLLYGTE